MAYDRQARQFDEQPQPRRSDPRALLPVLDELEAQFEQLFADWQSRAVPAEK
jgi:hypothetical protein